MNRDIGDIVFENMGKLILLLIGILIAGVMWVSSKEVALRPTAYSAWTNVTKSNITFDEWNAMRQTHTLPGQQAENTVVMPVYIPR